MKRGFQAPDDSDLKPFQQETVNSAAASAADESAASTTIDTAVFKARSRFNDPKRLPVFGYKDDILYLLEQKPTLILSGETGSGKSTMVPVIALRSYQRILVIEPRRLAAITLAKRVGKDHPAGLVGHGVRFEHNFTDNSRIVFVTDGVFLNMLMSDPLLTEWDMVIVDECHERTISLDICIGLLKKVVTKRTGDMRLVIMSATFDITNFVNFFGEDKCSVLSISGREHTVDVYYLGQACPDYIKAAKQTVVDICSEKLPGDILIFLTSSIEIEQLVKTMREEKMDEKYELFICQLYSTLPSNYQLKAIEPMFSRRLRRVVVSTNIAETSLTIPGVQYVIDCGFVRRRYFSPQDNIEAIVTVPISGGEALQRTGRAGRERPGGRVYRLWVEKLEKMEFFKPTEIERLDLSGGLVTLGSLGVHNYVTFPWLAPGPHPKILAAAVESLYAMEIVDKSGILTPDKGILVSEILTRIGGPGSGRRGMQHAILLLQGCKMGIGEEVCKIVALLSVKQIFQIPRSRRFEALRKHKQFTTQQGDLISLINVFDAYLSNKRSPSFAHKYFLNQLGLEQGFLIYERLRQTLKGLKLSPKSTVEPDTEMLQDVIASAYFLNSAYLHHDGFYYTCREKTKLKVHQDSCVFGLNPMPKVITFGDTTEASYQETVDVQNRVLNEKGSQSERLFLAKEITAYENLQTIHKAAPHYFSY